MFQYKWYQQNFEMDDKTICVDRTIAPTSIQSPKKIFLENSPKVLDNCPICLSSACEDRSQLFPCNHEYCFDCILQWSKVKNSCPLCNRLFTSIMHNIESDSKYEMYYVPDVGQRNSDWLEASITNIQRVVQSMIEDFSDVVNTAMDGPYPDYSIAAAAIEASSASVSTLHAPSLSRIPSVPRMSSAGSRLQDAVASSLSLGITSSTESIPSDIDLDEEWDIFW